MVPKAIFNFRIASLSRDTANECVLCAVSDAGEEFRIEFLKDNFLGQFIVLLL